RVSPLEAEERGRAACDSRGRAARAEVAALRRELRDLMWEDAGLVRTEAGLARALARIDELTSRLAGLGVPGGPAYNLAWQGWLDGQSQVLAARLIARSAIERRESRGAHYRADHPDTDDRHGLGNVMGAKQGDDLRVWTEPGRLTRARPRPPAPTAPI